MTTLADRPRTALMVVDVQNLVGDAHTTDDRTAYGAPPPEQVIAHTNLYWAHHEAPGRTAGAVPAVEVDVTGVRA